VWKSHQNSIIESVFGFMYLLPYAVPPTRRSIRIQVRRVSQSEIECDGWEAEIVRGNIDTIVSSVAQPLRRVGGDDVPQPFATMLRVCRHPANLAALRVSFGRRMGRLRGTDDLSNSRVLDHEKSK
jgi:hypothetical protein